MRRLSLLTTLVLTVALGGPVGQTRAQSSATDPVDPDCTSYPCGRIESIRQTMVKQTWTPLGANAGYGSGATGGGVSGGDAATVTSAFKIGPGLSNQGMVLLGAAGGAEYKKTPNSYDQPQWEVKVKLDTGRTRVVVMRFEPFVREGDRVRVVGSNVELL
jgi:outer membrane lipoprotein SlyB